jgi:protein-S-isoprenylcysteine O-methyltransferase Ste14
MVLSKPVLKPLQAAYLLFNLFFFPALLFLLSREWGWPEAWAYFLWYFTIFIFSYFYLTRHDPELLQERLRKPGTGGHKGWDKFFIAAMAVTLISYFILIPLDAKRFHWSPTFPLGLETLGFLMLFPATYLVFRSMMDNRFTSPYVRIQKERRQKVVTTGLYAIVRHPMYLGGLFWFFGTPLLLGSEVGLGSAVVLTFLFAARIVGEEAVLSKELKGYTAYKKKVRYRLIPGIW